MDTGNGDMFTVLTRLENAIRTNETTAIQTEMENLDTAGEQASRLRSLLGNNAQQVDSATQNLNAAQIDLRASLSRYEDADIVEAITNLNQQQTAFEAALKVTAQVSQLSILNYI